MTGPFGSLYQLSEMLFHTLVENSPVPKPISVMHRANTAWSLMDGASNKIGRYDTAKTLGMLGARYARGQELFLCSN